MNRDRGSASVWVLACGVLLLVVAVVTTVRATAVLARHRAQDAADLAALAAAARIGVDGTACAVGRRVAEANGAQLSTCVLRTSPDGRSGTVQVGVSVRVRLPIVGAGEVSATARAARDPPPQSRLCAVPTPGRAVAPWLPQGGTS